MSVSYNKDKITSIRSREVKEMRVKAVLPSCLVYRLPVQSQSIGRNKLKRYIPRRRFSSLVNGMNRDLCDAVAV